MADSDPHPTEQPAQVQTEQYLVFQQSSPNLVLVRQVEVPLYSQPSADGTKLDRDKRLSLAVARAVENGVPPHEPFEDEEFMVLDEVGDDEFETVEYEQNPAFDAVWDPESEGEN